MPIASAVVLRYCDIVSFHLGLPGLFPRVDNVAQRGSAPPVRILSAVSVAAVE
jgi:hypothetical protein